MRVYTRQKVTTWQRAAVLGESEELSALCASGVILLTAPSAAVYFLPGVPVQTVGPLYPVYIVISQLSHKDKVCCQCSSIP